MTPVPEIGRCASCKWWGAIKPGNIRTSDMAAIMATRYEEDGFTASDDARRAEIAAAVWPHLRVCGSPFLACDELPDDATVVLATSGGPGELITRAAFGCTNWEGA